MSKQIELLRARRFLPLFLTQALGAFNDNLFKSAFVMLITYGARCRYGFDPGLVAALAGGALIAPFFLFSATAGELADRFERARLLQILKAAELVAAFGAAAALLTGDIVLSLALLFVLGTQATLSSPVKYSLLPQHLATGELVDGNAVMEAGTFLSILFGTIAGGLAIAMAWGPTACGTLLLCCAVSGVVASLRVPAAPAPTPDLRISRNLVTATTGILRQAWQRRDVRLSILGASWFWLVGAVSLSQLPSFAKATLGADSDVVILFLAAFSIGVGVGSSLCGRLMHGEVSARYVPLAALGMTLFSLDLALASSGAAPPQRGAPRHRRFPVASRGAADLRRPFGACGIGRLLCRAALRDYPEPQRGSGAGAHHRRQQHRQRRVHGRRGARHRRTARGRARHSGAVSDRSASPARS